MKLKHTLIAGLVAGLSVVSVTAALAAPPDDGCAGGRAAWAGHPHGDMAAMAQQHLSKLKSELKLTSAQDSAWQAFSTQMTQSIAARQAARKSQAEPTGTAPERMGQHIEMLKQQLADMSAGQAALQDLYSVLSTDQRAIVDKHFAHMGGPGRPGGPARAGHGPAQ